MRYSLCPNPKWPSVPKLPTVFVETQLGPEILSFIFDITEPQDCFRQTCTEDGHPCWQDSCAEVFLNSPAHGGYYNFECNSAGVCLAEFGQSRSPRRQFTPKEYAHIRRTILNAPDITAPVIHWTLKVEIPREFIGLSPEAPVIGNLYKCASGAEIPHYLCAFPIISDVPDFHRPEAFMTMSN